LVGVKLELISTDDLESVEHRFENAILSGRCDVIADFESGMTGPGPISTAHKILNENDAKIKTTRIWVSGEFVSQSNVNGRSIPIGIKMGKWVYIVG
jgi:hypothetical protein